MKTEHINHNEASIPTDISHQVFISLEQTLQQQIVDMRIEIFLNQSAQYLQLSKKNL